MEFSFYDNNNKIQKINIKIGDSWSKLNIDHKLLNSIFSKIDDGDKKVSEKEFGALQYIFSLADKYIKKSADNKILENDELQTVLNKINDKSINIKDLKNYRIDSINLDDYSLESIQKRYPKNLYEVVCNGQYINIYDKKTKKQVLCITNNESSISICENPYTEKESYRFYKKEGNKASLQEYTIDGKKHVVLADDINKEITATNRFGLATTGKNLEKYVMKINKDNVLVVMWSYKACFGETLDEAINGEIMLDKSIKLRLINHLKSCLEKAYGYEPKFHKDNTMSTYDKKWRGNYLLDGDSNKIIIKDKKTGKTRTLDLNKLTKELPIESQIQIKQRLRNWPPEALMDLAIEVDSLESADFIDKYIHLGSSTQAMYRPLSDSIIVDVSGSPDVESSLLHELGHAIDYNGTVFNTASTEANEAFKNAFERELEAYKKAGNKPYEDGDSTDNYATKSKQEMFAECYCELVGAGCQSGRVIHQYFPETLKAADKLLQEIRSMPDKKRH